MSRISPSIAQLCASIDIPGPKVRKQDRIAKETTQPAKAAPQSALLTDETLSLAQSIQEGMDRVWIEFETSEEAQQFRKDWYRFRSLLRKKAAAAQFPRVFETEAKLEGVSVLLQWKDKAAFAKACGQLVRERMR